MTPGNETNPATTRRMTPASANAGIPVSATRAASRSVSTPPARWSRRRGVTGAFAAFATLGFLAAYVGPMGAAFAESDGTVAAASLYGQAVDGVQTVDTSDVIPAVALSRDGYTVYVKPTPKRVATTASSEGWVPPFVAPDPGTAKAIAYDMVKARGWGDDQYACLVDLWKKESGWRVNAFNKSSGAYGIPQALPGKKMASAGADWATNPATQIKWGLGYVTSRYGNPCGAWQHSQSSGWY